jgi:hypothetical protein
MRDFALEVGKYPANYLVTADESAVNLLTTYRLNGWSYKGGHAMPVTLCMAQGPNISSTP